MKKIHVSFLKKSFLLFLFISTCFITFSCSKSTQTTTTTGSNDTEQMLKKYSREGFINNNLFRVIIVEPENSPNSEDSIKEKAERRAFISFQKYIRSKGKKLKANAKPNLLNLINDSGKLMPIKDKKNSRTVYVFEVKKNNLVSYINKLGI